MSWRLHSFESASRTGTGTAIGIALRGHDACTPCVFGKLNVDNQGRLCLAVPTPPPPIPHTLAHAPIHPADHGSVDVGRAARRVTLDNPVLPITSFLKHDDVITVVSTKVVILPPSRETLIGVKTSAWKYVRVRISLSLPALPALPALPVPSFLLSSHPDRLVLLPLPSSLPAFPLTLHSATAPHLHTAFFALLAVDRSCWTLARVRSVRIYRVWHLADLAFPCSPLLW
jgi:hypothetical protein